MGKAQIMGRRSRIAQRSQGERAFVATLPQYEPLEGRRLYSVTTSTSDDFTDLSNYNYYGEVCLGDPSMPDICPAIDSGTISQPEQAYVAVAWGTNDDGSTDTGVQSFTLTITTSGVSWHVGNGYAADFSQANSGNFSKVAVRAGVMGDNMEATISNVTGAFYTSSGVGESDSVPILDANTLNSNSGNPCEALAIVNADNSGAHYNKVVVTGTFQLQAPAGTNPSATDLFCQVMVA